MSIKLCANKTLETFDQHYVPMITYILTGKHLTDEVDCQIVLSVK